MRNPLSDVEREALKLMADGLTYEEAASVSGHSRDTIIGRVRTARVKLAATNVTHAVAESLRYGYI